MFESIINRIRPSDPVKETIAASGERNRNHVV
jgi:hypothetical protein